MCLCVCGYTMVFMYNAHLEQEAIDSERKVVDLLVEQIECADFIVLNKKDKCSDEQMETLSGIVANINPSAHVVMSEWGKVSLDTVFGNIYIDVSLHVNVHIHIHIYM